MIDKPVSYAHAMKDFFYRDKTDNLQSFMAELRVLTQEDKQQFRDMLKSAGYQLTD